MRITNNMVSGSILTQIQNLSTQQAQLQAEVSSGLAVTDPSDSPAVFGQVVELQSQNSGLAQYGQNASHALDIANSSFSSLSSLTKVYDRASQLATLGTSVGGATSNVAYSQELDQLIQQSVQVANSQIGGEYLFGGTEVGSPPFAATTDSSGTITSVAYTGNSNQAAIPVSSTATVTPYSSGTTNQGMATFINQMIALRTALQTGDAAGVTAANQTMVSSEDLLTGAVAENGAVQARIQATQTQQQAEQTQLSGLISKATNADLPTTIVKLNQTQVAYQAALQTAASVMKLSILNYIQLS